MLYTVATPPTAVDYSAVVCLTGPTGNDLGTYRAAAPASEAGPSAPRRLASNWSRTPNGPALEQYILLTGSIHALRARDRFCWTCPVATCKRRVLKPYFAPMPLGSLDLLNLYIIVNVNYIIGNVKSGHCH